ncbi:MAG: hypothetical protein M5R37_09735 [Melioribacteraceae bacterium]|nr:hypothetical protein [Melioribacteraceae bacterium]
MEKSICPKCGTLEGKYHEDGCTLEYCPVCRNEKIFCQCNEVEDKKLRTPYIEYPLLCAKCGKKYPDLFRVDDREWEYYIQPDKRKEIICEECYNFIKEVIDGGAHSLPGFRRVDFTYRGEK